MSRRNLLAAASLVTVVLAVACTGDSADPRPSEPIQLIFSDADARVWGATAPGAKPILLIEGCSGGLGWSADGSLVWCVLNLKQDHPVLGAVNVTARGGVRQLPSVQCVSSGIAWSPDGSRYACAGRGLITITGDTAEPIAKLLAGCCGSSRSFSWSPSGGLLVYDIDRGGDYQGQRVIVDRDGTPVDAPDGLPGVGPPRLAWNPAGTEIAFVGTARGTSSFGYTYLYDFTNGDLRTLDTQPRPPSATRVVRVLGASKLLRVAPESAEIIDLDSGAITPLEHELPSIDFAVSPDGRWLAFMRQSSEQRLSAVVIDLELNESIDVRGGILEGEFPPDRRATPQAGYSGGPQMRFSSASDRLCWAMSGEDQPVYCASLDDLVASAVKIPLNMSRSSTGTWGPFSADLTSVAFRDPETAELVIADLSDGSLTRVPGSAGFSLFWWRPDTTWRPDESQRTGARERLP